MICQLCNRSFSRMCDLSKHLKCTHNMLAKDYYDTYLKKPEEGICSICGKPTKFHNFKIGYRKHCSHKCASIDPEKLAAIKATNQSRYGVDYVVKRSDVVEKSHSKESNLKKKVSYEQTMLNKYGVKHNFSLMKGKKQSQEIIDKRKTTCLEKYGCSCSLSSSEVREKIAQTNLERYGSENVFGSTEIQDKIKNTWIDKYGTDNPNKTKEIRDKIRQTNLNKYGCTDPRKNKEVQDKMKATCLQNNGVEHPNQNPDIMVKVLASKERLKQSIEASLNCTRVSALIKEYGYGWYESIGNEVCFKQDGFHFVKNEDIPKIQLYRKCNGSYTEYKIFEYLNAYDIKFKHHDRKLINPYELDFYLPDFNIGIECNGYYHEDNCYINRDQENYHKIKSCLCTEKNIDLWNVWESNLNSTIQKLNCLINASE